MALNASMEKIATQLKEDKTESKKTNIVKHKEPLELSDLEIEKLLYNSKNIETLEEVFELSDIGFFKEDEIKPETDGYYCGICFEGTTPNFDIQSSGSFLFNKIEDDKGRKNTQSVEFKNLKKTCEESSCF